jgi:hypothetical protein
MGCFVPFPKGDSRGGPKTGGVRKRPPAARALHIGLTGWLTLAVICAGIYIIEEQDHDCCGEGCPVCLQIAIAQRIIEAFGRFYAALLLAALLADLASRIKPSALFRTAPSTLVALKIKFNC